MHKEKNLTLQDVRMMLFLFIEAVIREIHRVLMEHILEGGVYRSVNVYISGAQYTPPSPQEMLRQLRAFYENLPVKKRQLNLIELAAWTHAEFVKIHPFPDGNVTQRYQQKAA